MGINTNVVSARLSGQQPGMEESIQRVPNSNGGMMEASGHLVAGLDRLNLHKCSAYILHEPLKHCLVSYLIPATTIALGCLHARTELLPRGVKQKERQARQQQG